jgi:hypothetical protein
MTRYQRYFAEQKILFNMVQRILPRKFDAKRRANFRSPKIFSLGEKLPKSSGITHMVTSNGGHPLHHHLRHHQANLHTVAASLCTVVHPLSGLLGHLFPPQSDRIQSYLTLYVMFWVCPDPEPA